MDNITMSTLPRDIEWRCVSSPPGERCYIDKTQNTGTYNHYNCIPTHILHTLTAQMHTHSVCSFLVLKLLKGPFLGVKHLSPSFRHETCPPRRVKSPVRFRRKRRSRPVGTVEESSRLVCDSTYNINRLFSSMALLCLFILLYLANEQQLWVTDIWLTAPAELKIAAVTCCFLLHAAVIFHLSLVSLHRAPPPPPPPLPLSLKSYAPSFSHTCTPSCSNSGISR